MSEKIEFEIVEASLENTLEEMKNRRVYLKKVMKPAEDAAKELEKATATEKVRLQGTKETKAPSLKPYTEALDVKDRKELGQLISGAKADGRPWTVKRCSEEKLKEGYRYTFFTNKVEQVFTESLSKSDLTLDEGKEEELPVEEPVEIELPPVEAPVEVELPIEEPVLEPEQSAECDECHKAIDILKGKLNFHPGEKEGTFVICLMDEEGKEKECIELSDLADEDLTTLNAVFFESEEFAKEQEEESPEEEVPAEEVVDLELEAPKEEEPIEEASSAEKKAYKHGGKYLKDLEFGRALARVKDPHERAMLLHQHKLEQSGKKMSDRQETEVTLDRKLNQAAAAVQDKFQDMADAGYALEEEKPLEEGVKISLDDLTLFKPWGGAKDVWELIIAQDKVKELDKALEDMYPEGITATDLNDILWFEKDWIFDTIDLKPFVIRDDAIEAEPEAVRDAEIETSEEA